MRAPRRTPKSPSWRSRCRFGSRVSGAVAVCGAAGHFASMLSVTAVSKSFPGVKSLQDVDFSVDAGEIHALVGENGAGKSTLIKIISGAYVPDQGTIELDGRKVAWSDPREAQSAGIHVIYQELALFPELTVAENVFINDQPINRLGIIDYGRMKQRADDALRLSLIHISEPTRPY